MRLMPRKMTISHRNWLKTICHNLGPYVIQRYDMTEFFITSPSIISIKPFFHLIHPLSFSVRQNNGGITVLNSGRKHETTPISFGNHLPPVNPHSLPFFAKPLSGLARNAAVTCFFCKAGSPVPQRTSFGAHNMRRIWFPPTRQM